MNDQVSLGGDYLDINSYDFELFNTFVNHNTFDEKLAV